MGHRSLSPADGIETRWVARVFMMREFLGLDTPSICQELAIATSHCHVIPALHPHEVAALPGTTLARPGENAMLTCRQVTHLLSEAQDRELRLKEKPPLKFHLLMCSGCASFRRQMDFLRRAARRYAQGHPNSDAS